MAGEDAKHFGDITSHAIAWYLELIVQPCLLLCAYAVLQVATFRIWDYGLDFCFLVTLESRHPFLEQHIWEREARNVAVSKRHS